MNCWLVEAYCSFYFAQSIKSAVKAAYELILSDFHDGYITKIFTKTSPLSFILPRTCWLLCTGFCWGYEWSVLINLSLSPLIHPPPCPLLGLLKKLISSSLFDLFHSPLSLLSLSHCSCSATWACFRSFRSHLAIVWLVSQGLEYPNPSLQHRTDDVTTACWSSWLLCNWHLCVWRTLSLLQAASLDSQFTPFLTLPYPYSVILYLILSYSPSSYSMYKERWL